MKTINYTGSSKLISRIVNLLNRKVPLPLDGDGNPTWGTNGQVLTTDGSGNSAWTSGGGGHTIQNNGTDMTSRAKLDFIGATVTDDAVNDATVVKVPSGGDSVAWTQITNTGTKIAEIDINGTPTDVYTPTGGGSTYTEGDGIDINSSNVISVDTTFTEASTRANIASGDTFATILGKIKKFFTDLKTVAFTGSYTDLSDKPTIPDEGSYISRDKWWLTTETHSADDLVGGAVFAYSTHTNTATTGTLVDLAGGGTNSANYRLQLQGAYASDALFFRRRNGDNNAWGSWRELVHSGNIGSQSVNYATSAGSATSATSATKSTQDADGNDIRQKYVNIYNSSNIGSSATVTVNDLANQGSSVGMIYAATDNPQGSAKWFHVWSQAWSKGANTSWVSQIAIGTQNGTGMYYRTNGSGSIVGKAWTRIIDSANIGSQSVNYATSAKTASRLGTYWNSYLVTARTSWSVLSLNAPSNVVSVMACPAGRLSNQPQWYVEYSGKSVKLYYKNSVDYSADGYTIWVMC